ncbi:tryptophan 7-halogenase [Alteromonas oceanisediminis]|uniref:tryptophan 7-halogenase n=1 Tax=Alteromonas oceanisediminis TaxID=2836180 RepID=UPI001BD9A11F|nr:tryptophan 7-halogenase [Alteromonas oceanisediminis]MBT0584979.1 tryptophan 7-halogenase [Alteromonas oceanisediminis]
MVKPAQMQCVSAKTTPVSVLVMLDQSSTLLGMFCAAMLSQAGFSVNVNKRNRHKHHLGDHSAVVLTPELLITLSQLGIEESALVGRAEGQYYLADRLMNWRATCVAPESDETLIGLAPSGVNANGIRFLHYLTRYRAAHSANLSDFSLNTLCAQRGVFTHPVSDPRSVLSTLEYGLMVNTEALVELLREVAIRCGAGFDASAKSMEHNLTIDCCFSDIDDGNWPLPFSTYRRLSEAEVSAMSVLPLCHNQAWTEQGLAQTCQLKTSRHGQLFGHQAEYAFAVGNSAPPEWVVSAEVGQIILNNQGLMRYLADQGLLFYAGILQLLSDTIAREAPDQLSDPVLHHYFNRTALQRYSGCYDTAMLRFYFAQPHTEANRRGLSQYQPSSELTHLFDLYSQSGVLPEYEHYEADTHWLENSLAALGQYPQGHDLMVDGLSEQQLDTFITQIRSRLNATAQRLPRIEE